MDEPPTLLFDIRTAKDVVLPNVELYDCSYESRGRTAKFRLEFHELRAMSGSVIPLAPAEGRFVAAKGSDNSTLLEDLMKVLEAKRLPAPAGDWKTIEIFFPKGGDDGETREGAVGSAG